MAFGHQYFGGRRPLTPNRMRWASCPAPRVVVLLLRVRADAVCAMLPVMVMACRSSRYDLPPTILASLVRGSNRAADFGERCGGPGIHNDGALCEITPARGRNTTNDFHTFECGGGNASQVHAPSGC